MLKQIRYVILGILLASLALPAGNALAALAPHHQIQQQDSQAKFRPGFQPSGLGQQPISMAGPAHIIEMHAQRKRISASQAKSAAMSRVHGARFVNVQLINQSTYRVRLQHKNGKIVDVYVDAYTGRVKG